MTTEKKRWLTPQELETEYSIAEATQAKYRMRDSKVQIPFSKVGAKFIRYDRLKIENWLENHDVKRSER